MDAPRTLHRPHHLISYFRAFYPGPRWGQLPSWPPDVFALCNLVLDHTESFRFVVAPPPGRHWPPSEDWNHRVTEAAAEWRDSCGGSGGELPGLVRDCWDVVSRSRTVSLDDVRSGEAWELCQALLTLHATADEACVGLARRDLSATGRSFEARAWKVLMRTGSLSHLSPSRVRVLPKTNLSPRGITIRSLSRYLALCYEAVDVRWRRMEAEPLLPRPRERRRKYNVLLVPWPLAVKASDFAPVRSPLGNMDSDLFGFFEFAPATPLDVSQVSALLATARSEGCRADAVILPECAVEPAQVPELEDALAEQGATFLITGVREAPSSTAFGRNYVHFGVHAQDGWHGYDQDKHHRWCLDASQIRQYHLSHALDPKKLWWEAIDLGPRAVQVVDVGGGTTAAALVCEDLARMDEVADVLRRIGPSVVIALLLDGPQLTSRWPCRYASVLADEPGSCVLTLTSFGMAMRSRPPGMKASRVVALWNDRAKGLREIELDHGAQAVMVTAREETRPSWTADGRLHGNVPSLVLSTVNQLRLPSPKARSGRGSSGEAVATSVPPYRVRLPRETPPESHRRSSATGT